MITKININIFYVTLLLGQCILSKQKRIYLDQLLEHQILIKKLTKDRIFQPLKDKELTI